MDFPDGCLQVVTPPPRTRFPTPSRREGGWAGGGVDAQSRRQRALDIGSADGIRPRPPQPRSRLCALAPRAVIAQRARLVQGGRRCPLGSTQNLMLPRSIALSSTQSGESSPRSWRIARASLARCLTWFFFVAMRICEVRFCSKAACTRLGIAGRLIFSSKSRSAEVLAAEARVDLFLDRGRLQFPPGSDLTRPARPRSSGKPTARRTCGC